MFLNFILIIIGLVICFGGIYFKRVTSALLGIINGVVIGALLALLISFASYDSDLPIVAVVICTLLFGVLSAIYYKVFAVINMVIGTLAFAGTILVGLAIALMGTAGGGAIMIIAVLLAIALAVLVGWLTHRYYDYTYIIITAAFGGLLASIGFVGLVSFQDLTEMVDNAMYGYNFGFGWIIFLTLIMTGLGFYVQNLRLKGVPFKDALPANLQIFLRKAKGSVGNAAQNAVSTVGKTVQKVASGSKGTKTMNAGRQPGPRSVPKTPSQTDRMPPRQGGAGQRLVKRCPRCGTILDANAGMCSTCGVVFIRRQ